jgi:fungal STAND N-terminal Goodbye domain
MSSTGQATSSTSNFQLIIDAALADYTKITGTDLSNTPFATAIQQSNSPEAILQLLHEREKTFKEYRDGNRKLINCLTPTVKVFQALSGILGEAVNQVSRMPSIDSFNSDLVRSHSHRQTPCLLPLMLYVLSVCFSTGSPVMSEYSRLPVG